jgi:hypothetical protein
MALVSSKTRDRCGTQHRTRTLADGSSELQNCFVLTVDTSVITREARIANTKHLEHTLEYVSNKEAYKRRATREEKQTKGVYYNTLEYFQGPLRTAVCYLGFLKRYRQPFASLPVLCTDQ